ncbi:MAG: SDR family oxidoreductase [Rhodothermales bacterium]
MYFKDQVVWITGASSGIGEALALDLSQRDAILILSARNREKLEAVRQRCARPDRVEVLPLDLSDIGGVERVAGEGLALHGRVDFLINNGGVSQRALVEDTSMAVYRQLIDTNLLGPIALTKALVPSMRARKWGHIITVSSLTGKFSTPLRSGYAASKHALHGFFDALRMEVWRDGIRVTVVCPGYVRTNVSLNALTGDGTPQGTMDKGQEKGMSPAKCADLILWAAERGKNEVYIGGFERFYVYFSRLFPDTFKQMIRTVNFTPEEP